MPSFSVAPGAFPPAVPEDFPDFLRWQDEGTYLDSSRTIDTVNLTGAGIQDVSVDSGGTVLTITLGSPVASKSPGWMTNILSSASTPLYANEGYGTYQDFISPPGVTIQNVTYAGIENYTGETIVWVPTWVPQDADPSPTVTPLSGGRVEVYWGTIGGGWPKTSQGTLTLACTVDGNPGAGTIELVSGVGGDYTQMAWGPTP